MAEAQGLDEATVAELRLHRGNSDERGLDAVGRERAHRRVSRAADSKAELTMALDGARARRRPRNRQRSKAGGGGALCTCG
jgi:alkylhydroperoxidase family enzyme